MESNKKTTLANVLMFLLLVGLVWLGIFVYTESGKCLKRPCGYCKEQNPEATISKGTWVVQDYYTVENMKSSAREVFEFDNVTEGVKEW